MVPARSDHLEMTCPIHWDAITKHTVIPTKQWPHFIMAQDGISTSAGQRPWKYQVFGCFVTNCPGLKQNILRCQSKESWFYLVLKWVVNACNLLQKHSCWGQLIRERTSQPQGTINTDPSTCSPEPTVGIISKPVPEHHKVQAGLEAKKGSNRITEDLASDALWAEKIGPDSNQRWLSVPKLGHKEVLL